MRLALLFVCTLFLAGCATPAADVAPQAADASGSVAPRLHALAELLPFEAIADDGTVLRGHVYLPDGKGPFATILELSPYWNTGYGPSEGQAIEVDGRTTLDKWLGRYLDAGFAVALVNMRGSGESGGCFQFGLPLDWSDAYVVVETLAAQPWSNGNVGMNGLSYPGWTQYMALAAKPPSLKAVIPVSGIIDPWNLWGRNGALLAPSRGGGVASYPLFAGISTTGALEQEGADTRVDHFTCPQYAGDALTNLQFAANGDRTEHWKVQDLRPHINGTTVPTFFTNGLTYGEGHILQFEGLWDLLAGPKRMLLGQWGHGYPDLEGGHEAFANMTVAWFDHYLRGGPALVEAGVVEYQDKDGIWHTTDRWPPVSNATILRPSGDALVADGEPIAAGAQTIQSHPLSPAPSDCGRAAIYVSPPLAQDALLAGNFRVELTLTSDLHDGNLAAVLYRLPAAHSCAAMLDWLDPTIGEIGRALGDLRHAYGGEEGADFPLLTPTAVTLVSHPFASPVKAGDRLALVVGGGHFELQPDPIMPRLTVTTGEGISGAITLPVVEGVLSFEP